MSKQVQTSQGSNSYPFRTDFLFVYILHRYPINEHVCVNYDKNSEFLQTIRKKSVIIDQNAFLDLIVKRKDIFDSIEGYGKFSSIPVSGADERYWKLTGIKNGVQVDERAFWLSDGIILTDTQLLGSYEVKGQESGWKFQLDFPNGAIDFAYIAHAGGFIPELVWQRGITETDISAFFHFLDSCISIFAKSWWNRNPRSVMFLRIDYKENGDKPDMFELVKLLDTESCDGWPAYFEYHDYFFEPDAFLKRIIEYKDVIARIWFRYNSNLTRYADKIGKVLTDLSSFTDIKVSVKDTKNGYID